jgi:benzoate membrane transport protein
MTRADAQPALAGVVAAIVGFAGSFAVVLAGLRAVGADRAQASSGLLVLSVAMGLTAIVLCWRSRMPLSIAWSTPGAALLIGAGAVHGGYASALGAFVVAGLLTVIAGLSAPFERAIAAIPAPLASALLAGVLLPVCLAPAHAAVALPGLTAPVIVTWLVLMRIARRLAVPGALLAAGIALAVDGRLSGGAFSHPLPSITATLPHLDPGTIAGVGLPLFLVTMASQNLAGMSVLALHGYRPRLRPVLTTTGAVSAVIAPLGGHGINLAAITAALMAGPDAGPRPERRWIAGAAAGATHVGLGLAAGLATAFIATAPPVLIEAVAGLALLGALGGALTAATEDPIHRDAALVTFVVTASQITAVGLSAPFWGLLAGLGFLGLQRAGRHPAAPGSRGGAGHAGDTSPRS